jgi:hypothetical protein
MASTVEIRQATVDWQGATPSVSLNLLKTSVEGDVSVEHFKIEGAFAQNIADAMESALLAKAAIKFPGRTVKMITPPAAEV